jgi:uncharacterized protein (TIGR02217 family)
MTEPVFPSLPGVGWPVTRRLLFATRTQKSVSGRELRISDQLYPIWEWTLVFPLLRDRNDTRGGPGIGSGYDELRTLAGFFAARRGAFQPFLYLEPSDSAATNEYLGTSDGANLSYQLVRTLGGFTEPVTAPLTVTMKDNGLTIPSGNYTVDYATGIVSFGTARPAGHIITADIAYYFRCRFVDDTFEFENSMYQLHEVKQLKFRSVLT